MKQTVYSSDNLTDGLSRITLGHKLPTRMLGAEANTKTISPESLTCGQRPPLNIVNIIIFRIYNMKCDYLLSDTTRWRICTRRAVGCRVPRA